MLRLLCYSTLYVVYTCHLSDHHAPPDSHETMLCPGTHKLSSRVSGAWRQNRLQGCYSNRFVNLCCRSSSTDQPTTTYHIENGTCYLVGAGPGDPDLLTVRAMKLLNTAEVVVYDDLGAQAVLDLAPEFAQCIYVGKRGGQAGSWKQHDIDQLLVELCKQGKDVVRLKGGCPSVFSRVHSELAALRTAGIPCVLVPGVSSVLAASLLAGFPLTDAEHGTSFAVLTGHDIEAIDWPTYAKVPTLVFLMGGRTLPDIVQKLVEHGRPSDTPVCIIRSAGQPSQQIWHGQLTTILSEVQNDSNKLSPCIIIIGKVAVPCA